jgi:hypothetical protein
MDRADHRQTLTRVERELAQLLDDSAGRIGHEVTMYRALLWDARGHVKAAAAQLDRIPTPAPPERWLD